MFGVRVAFLATQGGLTRWMDFGSSTRYELKPGCEIITATNFNNLLNVTNL